MGGKKSEETEPSWEVCYRERTWEGLEYYVKILLTGGRVSNAEGTEVAQEHWTLVNRQVQPMGE